MARLSEEQWSEIGVMIDGRINTRINEHFQSFRAEIDQKTGPIMTDFQSQIDKNKNLAGTLFEDLEKTKAQTAQSFAELFAGTQSEFAQQKVVVNEIVTELGISRQKMDEMMVGLKGELDVVKARSSGSASGSVGSADTAVGRLREELDAPRHEMIQIKAEASSTGLVGAARGGKDKFGGFIPLKNLTPKPFRSKEEHWREWVE